MDKVYLDVNGCADKKFVEELKQQDIAFVNQETIFLEGMTKQSLLNTLYKLHNLGNITFILPKIDDLISDEELIPFNYTTVVKK